DTVPTDPDDNRVLECAVSAGSQTIVTGDDDLLRLVGLRGIEIVRVADFLTRSSGSGRQSPLQRSSADAPWYAPLDGRVSRKLCRGHAIAPSVAERPSAGG